jgi:hypothetical protein
MKESVERQSGIKAKYMVDYYINGSQGTNKPPTIHAFLQLFHTGSSNGHVPYFGQEDLRFLGFLDQLLAKCSGDYS